MRLHVTVSLGTDHKAYGKTSWSSSVVNLLSNNPDFQILGDDRRACRSLFLVHVCPSPSKQTTPLKHITSSWPHTSTSWWWISTGRMFIALKNRTTERTSQSGGLINDMVLHKAVWHSNHFTKWIGKHWKRCRGSDESSRPSKTFSQWPVNGQDVQTVLTLKMTRVGVPDQEKVPCEWPTQIYKKLLQYN
jgi:hypothetical protein